MAVFDPMEYALVFVVLGLFVQAFCATVISKLPEIVQPPLTAVLFSMGALFSLLHKYAAKGSAFEKALTEAQDVNPHVILFLLLPPLLLESAVSINYYVFRKVALQAVLLASVSVGISVCICAVLYRFALPYEWPWALAFLVGAIMSATDPVAVVAVLKQLGAPQKLSTLIDGEALMNDGTAFVMYLIFKLWAEEKEEVTAGGVIWLAVRLSLGGPALGWACGFVTYYWLLADKSPLVQVSLIIIGSYMVFVFAEMILHVSGVLATVFFGLYFSRSGQYAMTFKNVESFHENIEFVAGICNGVIFFLAGANVFASLFVTSRVGYDAKNWGYLIFNYLCLMITRTVAILALWPVLHGRGYRFTLKELCVSIFGGLRGAVSLAMVILPVANVSKTNLDLMKFHVSGIVLLTTLINGTTSGKFYRWLQIYPPNPFANVTFDTAIEDILYSSQRYVVRKMKGDWLFSQVHWSFVYRILPDFSSLQLNWKQHVAWKRGHKHETVIEIFNKEGKTRALQGAINPEAAAAVTNARTNRAVLLGKKTKDEMQSGAAGEGGDLTLEIRNLEQQLDKRNHSRRAANPLTNPLVPAPVTGLRRRRENQPPEKLALHMCHKQFQELVSNFYEQANANYRLQMEFSQISEKSFVLLSEGTRVGMEKLFLKCQEGEGVELTEAIICEWDYVRSNLQWPVSDRLLRWKESKFFPLRLYAEYKIFKNLCHSISTLSGFIRARHHVGALSSFSELSQIIQEQMSRATTVLNHIQITYPTQSMVEETRLAARVLISFNRHFIARLEEEGCLQKSHAHKMIQILNSRDRELQRSRMSLSLAYACSERDSHLAKTAKSYVVHVLFNRRNLDETTGAALTIQRAFRRFLLRKRKRQQSALQARQKQEEKAFEPDAHELACRPNAGELQATLQSAEEKRQEVGQVSSSIDPRTSTVMKNMALESTSTLPTLPGQP